jgi:integrase
LPDTPVLLPQRYPEEHVTMSTKVLTPLVVGNTKPGRARREIPDGGCRGLYLIVQPTGSKSWAVRYRLAGKPDKLTLGPVLHLERGEREPERPGIGAPLSLAAARKLAAETLHQVELGHDPQGAKKAGRLVAQAAAADTFQAIAETYLAREGNGLRTADRRRADLERLVYPVMGSRPIGDIKRSEVNQLLDRIEDDSGPVMADKMLAVLSRVMSWHASRSDDFRSPIVRGMARTKPRQRARERVLEDEELRRVWQAADAGGKPFDSLIQFLLATGARRTEAAGMRWDELSGADWILPAARNKTKQELVRPLSGLARAILAKIPRIDGCDFVFTTGQRPVSGFSKFKKKFDGACGASDWTLHDLRRTARSLMSRAGVNTDHAERVLGHVIGGVRHHYDRHDYHAEKVHAAEALAAQIERILEPPGSKVTPLHARP